MRTITPDRTKTGRIGLRLWWVGLLAIIASVAANVLVRLLAVVTLDISPDFEPLSGYGTVISLTAFGVLGAVIVFALLARFARRPILMFKRIAAVALVLSFVPDVLLLVASVPGATAVSVGVLMVMHVVTWAISVGMLTTLAGIGNLPDAAVNTDERKKTRRCALGIARAKRWARRWRIAPLRCRGSRRAEIGEMPDQLWWLNRPVCLEWPEEEADQAPNAFRWLVEVVCRINHVLAPRRGSEPRTNGRDRRARADIASGRGRQDSMHRRDL